ncbi:DgaE family pyridoxal phosphate-dependent ammonia lyase [Acidaminobacter sp. JC074]|uniref:DgaE family pyridoxal phosphate-dependent ammonia lyase n=1 Tax=Acidaminobacter sp. JC074 TaxID=2530199 RepID=UPI001F112593|nr:DgaE family pyridoxal phosphate-dependent ammonia lyase [Acidaminobacter sp. JC074]MCH4887920.1 DgaE family pyridoxal phosphate-dependent ammonia lyase [Acidaminobacter sp. JC074]
MSIYQDIDLDQVINCSGKMTALGVSKISDDVSEAMKHAGQSFVVIDELIDRVGERISLYTGGEDTCVTCSASAGIAISVAAAIAGKNRSLIEALPNVNEKKEIIIQKGHMINFGAPIQTMIQLGGGKIVDVGAANKVLVDHLEEAINENTAALLYVKSHHCVQKGMVSLEDMIQISRKHSLPLIVDAAAEGDLKKYTAMGADLVIYSGAKALEGPSSGFITGKKALIEACKKQYLGIARAMKIGKENMMGLLRAVEAYADRDLEKNIEVQKSLVSELINGLKDIKGMTVKSIQDEAGRPIFRVEVTITDRDCLEVVKKLKSGKVRVYVREHFSNVGRISIDVRSIDQTDLPVIIDKFKEVMEA